MKRILVIGGTGNVGRHVVDHLQAVGARIRVMVRNPDAAAWKMSMRSSWYGSHRRRQRGIFARNARHFWAPQIRAGSVVRWPYLDAPTAPTDKRDVAAVAVHALCGEGHSGAEYVVTGPQSLTQAEQVRTIGRAIGRTLDVEEISPDDARLELLPVLGSPIFVDMLLAAWAAAVGQPAFVTSTCAEITGAPPRTFRKWATDHAAEFRS